MSTSGGTSGGGGGSGTVTSVTATDTTVTISGSPTVAPTVGVNAIPESKVTSLVSDLALKAPLASPTFTGVPAAPTAAAGDNTTQLATDAFVTTAVANAIAGVNPAVAVQAATAAVLQDSPTYANGAAGIGATLTANANNTTLVVDGYTPVAGDRLLVKTQAAALQNGVYTVTQQGGAVTPWILTRALDYNQPSDINNTGAIPVVNGTVNTTTSWVLTSKVTTVGTDALTFTRFTINPTTILTNTLASAHLLVGSAGGVATDTAVTGDVTIGNTGVTAIGATKVTNAMLAGSIDLAAKVTGTLPVGNGGTGVTTATAHGVLIGEGTSPHGATAAGTAGQQLQSGGAAADPVWATFVDEAAWVAPTGSLAATWDRRSVANANAVPTSGTLYLQLIVLRAGVTYTNANFRTSSTTAGASLTHYWNIITDINRVVLAATADDTAAAWAVSTIRTEAFTSAYTPTVTGVYYLGFMVAGTTMPTMSSIAIAGAQLQGIPPIVAGTSNTAQTTPLAVSATANALTVATFQPLGWLT